MAKRERSDRSTGLFIVSHSPAVQLYLIKKASPDPSRSSQLLHMMKLLRTVAKTFRQAPHGHPLISLFRKHETKNEFGFTQKIP
jgi:hypothetical protein